MWRRTPPTPRPPSASRPRSTRAAPPPSSARAETAQRILGETGILSGGPPLPAAEAAGGDAFEALCDWLSAGGERRILALGPLTNIAALALARPDLAAKITDLVWMGGGVTAGNHTASAEFNAFADPEAVAIVLGHGLPLRMVDLDLCRQVTAGPADVAAVRDAGGPHAAALAGMFAAFIDIAVSRGRPEMALYDAAAAVAVAAPAPRHIRPGADRDGARRHPHPRPHGGRPAQPGRGQRRGRRRHRRPRRPRDHPRRAGGRSTMTADLADPALRARAVAAARGDAPFDILVAGGTVIDMVTGKHRAADVGLVGPLIASVHPRDSRSDAGETIDATGGFVVPGLIDTHMHVESSMVTPAVYAEAVVPRGVTTVVWDPHEFGNVSGIAGVRWAVDAAKGLPLRVLTLAPSCVPSAPGLECAGADFDAATIAELLSWPEIAGLAEVMTMRPVIDGDPRMSAIVNAALASGKLVRGHARSLAGADLAAFVAAGIGSDHELTSADDLLEKLAAGLTIEMRGSHPHLLPEFAAALVALGHLPPTLTLCTDDTFPDDLARDGGLDMVLRHLVRHGMPPEWVLRAATYNAAIAIARPDLGLVAPGRRADLAVFSRPLGLRGIPRHCGRRPRRR